MIKDIVWFKKEIAPLINQFELKYSTFKNGDLGDLERVELEGNKKGGNIDFWSTGWLNIHLVDYEKEIELLNILLDPNQDKEQAFKDLQDLLELKTNH